MNTLNVHRRQQFFYGWFILGLSFLALFSTFGIRGSFGSYVTSWEQEFAISRTAVATISLVSFFILAIAQPTVGRLNDRFGARTVLTGSMLLTGVALLLCSVATQLWQLIILYGVVLSFALTGGSNITATAVITRWFTAKRGFAIGLTMSGMAVGQLMVVPLSLYLISHYNWRFTLGLLGLIMLAVFTPLMAFFVRSKPADVGLQPYGEQADTTAGSKEVHADPAAGAGNRSVWTIMRHRAFWQLSIPYFFCGFTDVGLIQTHYIPFAQGKGFSLGIIAFTFSLIALANIAGTIGTGYLADRWNRSRLLAMIYGIRGVTFVFLLTANKPWLLVIFALVYGITEMASITPTSSLCANLFQKYSIGMVFGIVSVSHQLGGAVGSLVPGIIYDSVHSYIPVFILSAITMAISGVIVSRIPDNRGRTVMSGGLRVTSGE